MRRWLVRIGVGLVVVILAALGGGYGYASPLLLTGTGYAAHNACALSYLAVRANPAEDLPPNPLVPYLRTSASGEQARASVWGFLAGQQAFFTGGYGCTLGGSRPSFPAATPVTQGSALPVAPSTDAAVTHALAQAFGDDLDATAKAHLGTRAVVVVKDGRIVAERYADPFTADTPQLGWSMSKSVASLLTGKLVAEGIVRVGDDHLRPEWADQRARISVDDLLRMTSGLQWDETYDLGTPITRMLYLEPDMGRYVASLPAAHAPGSYQQYSSGSTTLLCSILAARTGTGPDLPRRELFSPLGLGSAVWEPDAAGTPVCSSYLWATPRDWATIGQFALQDGVWEGKRLLPEGWMRETTTVKPVAQTEETGYAAGWWVNRLPDGSLGDRLLPADAYAARGHDGQRLYVVPSAGLVVVRLGFSPGVSSEDLRTSRLVAELVRALP